MAVYGTATVERRIIMRSRRLKRLTAALAACAVMATALPVVPNVVSAASHILRPSTFDLGRRGWNTG